jgi:hypothetical protein
VCIFLYIYYMLKLQSFGCVELNKVYKNNSTCFFYLFNSITRKLKISYVASNFL